MQAEKIGAEQLHILGQARRYLRETEARGIDVGMSALCYLNSWTPVPGYAKLQRWRRGGAYLWRSAVIIVKDMAAIARRPRYLMNSGPASSTHHSQLVISWARGQDFTSDGSFQDRYFNTNSRETPQALWFLISLDGCVPAELDSNIRVMRPAGESRKYDLLFFIKAALWAIVRCRRSLSSFPHYFSSASVMARRVSHEVGAELRRGHYSSVIIPYEAQPFQHVVFREAKGLSKEIQVIGYLHSALPPLPTDLIFRPGAPDVLLVHGAAQVDILQSRLDWPLERLRSIPSLRYRRDQNASFAGYVFFPYSFFDGKLIVREFAAFLRGALPGSMRPLQVRNHPNMGGSRRHLKLKRQLEELLRKFSDRFSPSAGGDSSVFIGATASILEALERGVDVVHICSDPVLESHSEEVWPCLSVKQLSMYVFRYGLRTPGRCIALGSEENMFLKYVAS